jgi:hypothetical protein
MHLTLRPERQEHRAVEYVNGVYQGGVDELKNVQASAVREIRFLSDREGMLAYGSNHNEGVIDIRTGPPQGNSF